MEACSAKLFVAAAGDLLGEGIAVRFKATGQSMHPSIKDGEMIIVEPAVPESIKPGDIILYRTGSAVIAHRVIRMDKRGGDLRFILRGDAATSADRPVSGPQVLGRVVSVERSGRAIDLTGAKARLLRAFRTYRSLARL